MKKKRKLGRKLLSFLLTLAMVVGLMPGMGLTAYAEGEATPTAAERLAPMVDDNSKVTDAKILEYAGQQWYVIASGTTGVQIASGAVTTQDGATTLVLLAKENWGTAVFNDTENKNAYGNSNLKIAVDGFATSKSIETYYTDTDEWKNSLVATRTLAGGASSGSSYTTEDNISGSEVAKATLWPLSANEVSQISSDTIMGNGNWWLRSPGSGDSSAACVYSGSLRNADVGRYQLGVRPALCLNLTSDIFASEKSDESGVYELTKGASDDKESVSYMMWDETEKKLVEKTGDDACTDYTVVDSSTTTWGTANTISWYVVNSDVTINSAITFTGDVHLILYDGATLTVNGGIKKSQDNTNANLTIYGQSEGTGALNVTSDSTSAIDNSYNYNSYGGNIKINGGKITARATGANGHGIYAKDGITINGGEVNAEAIANGNVGIWASYGTVTINGGKITAKVTNGGGSGTGIHGSGVIISDGEVIAVGNYAAIGCNVKNEIAGTGWTNTDGTDGKANIAVSDTARELSDYKKMWFTAAKDDITASADSITATYDGKAHGITVSVTVPASGATIKYGKTEGTYDLTSSPTITDVKDSPLTVYYKVTADGYNDLTGSATVTISKANAVAATVTANTRTYDGTDNPLVTVDNSTLVGGTMYYALGEDATTAPADNLYTTSIPTATDAGTYYVWYKVKGNDNHSDSKEACVTVKIKEASTDEGEKEVSTDVKSDGKSPALKADNLTNEFAESTLTSDEKAKVDKAVAAGEKVDIDVFLEIKDIADNVAAADKDKVKAVVADANDIEYFDISLFKEIFISNQSQGATALHTLSSPLKLTIGVPKSFPAVANGYTRTYVVIRLHDGKAEKLPTSLNADGTISFETDKFSTYALAYTDVQQEAAAISMNAGLKISQTGSKINIKWGKVNEADGYDVYVTYCGKKFGKAAKTVKKNSTTSVKITKINGKKINLKKNYKVYVAAYKLVDGKKKVLAKTIMGHVVGRKNTKYSNAKKITLSKSSYTIKVGKTAKIKAKTVLVQKGKKQLSNAHAAEFRYASSSKSIATVDKMGKIKGIAKGTCTIYVYARNGYAKTVKVTVK